MNRLDLLLYEDLMSVFVVKIAPIFDATILFLLPNDGLFYDGSLIAFATVCLMKKTMTLQLYESRLLFSAGKDARRFDRFVAEQG